MPCIANGKESKETFMDVYVRRKYYIKAKEEKDLGSSNIRQFIIRETYR